MDDKVRIYVFGLSYSQLQSGAYALVLAEENGRRRIPVMIGPAEAQSIAVALENVHTPRPLTHDLFVSFAHAFGVKLVEVYIYRFSEGIFSAELTFTDGDRTIKIDARTSDAIAIAVRTHTPIYTSEEILQKAGFIIEDEALRRDGDDDQADADTDEAGDDYPAQTYADRDDYMADPDPEKFTVEELERTLARLIDEENYEEAERISLILNKKKNGGNTSAT